MCLSFFPLWVKQEGTEMACASPMHVFYSLFVNPALLYCCNVQSLTV